MLIFIAINSVAYLFIRYTKNLYESESVLKLDVKTDATELGIKTMVEDQNMNMLAGEIEIIRSKLFLNRVLDSTNIEVSFYSIGRVLNDELFGNPPIQLHYTVKHPSIYNEPVYFDEDGPSSFVLRFHNSGREIKGRYNEKISLDNIELIIHKNEAFRRGDEIGYFFTINSRDKLLDYLLSNLSAEPINYNANTLRVSFKDYNPFKTQAILNKIDTVYLQYSNEQKNLANTQKIEWLVKELGQIEKKMESFENYFEDFTLQNKTSDLGEDLKKTIITISRIDSQRYELSRKIIEINQLLDNIQTSTFFINGSQRQMLPDFINKNLDELQRLVVEQEKVKMSYSEITFAFRQKQKEIENIKDKAFKQLTDLKSDFLRKLQELNQRKIKLEYEFAGMPDKNTQFTKNQRYYKLYEEFYLTLMKSKSEFEIAQAGSTPDFKILSPATFPTKPISPGNFIIAGIGFVASLVTIIFLFGILYLANNKITNLLEIERVSDVPVLGVVPASRHVQSQGLHVVEHPKSMVSEAIRTLRTNLEFFNVSSTKKVIAVSSTVSGEGKSFIAMNLGGVIALSKKKVILLDLDMRKPKTHQPASPEDKTKGISTILIRKNTWQECIVQTALEQFDYIPAGPHPPNPSELLLNGEFAALLEELKKNYDFIILDTPPVGLVTDGIMAMKRADISIYIFRANYSKKDFLLNLKRIVTINKFSNITSLLNALPPTSEKNYGYGYYEDPSQSSRIKSIFKR